MASKSSHFLLQSDHPEDPKSQARGDPMPGASGHRNPEENISTTQMILFLKIVSGVTHYI